MKTLALALTALLVLMAPVSRVQAQYQSNGDVSIDFFYDARRQPRGWLHFVTAASGRSLKQEMVRQPCAVCLFNKRAKS